MLCCLMRHVLERHVVALEPPPRGIEAVDPGVDEIDHGMTHPTDVPPTVALWNRLCGVSSVRSGPMRGTAFFYRHLPRLSFWLNRMTRANYEREMELLHILCDPSRPGIDVGAKVGMYTYRIRAHSSHVIAFEPIPVFHEMLRAVFEGKGGRIEPFAVSNARG